MNYQRRYFGKQAVTSIFFRCGLQRFVFHSFMSFSFKLQIGWIYLFIHVYSDIYLSIVLHCSICFSLFCLYIILTFNIRCFSRSHFCHLLSLPCQQLHGFLSPSLITQALHHAEHKRISVNKWCFSSWCSGMDYSLFLTWMTMIIKSGNTDSSLSLLYSLLLSSDSFSFLGALRFFFFSTAVQETDECQCHPSSHSLWMAVNDNWLK